METSARDCLVEAFSPLFPGCVVLGELLTFSPHFSHLSLGPLETWGQIVHLGSVKEKLYQTTLNREGRLLQWRREVELSSRHQGQLELLASGRVGNQWLALPEGNLVRLRASGVGCGGVLAKLGSAPQG